MIHAQAPEADPSGLIPLEAVPDLLPTRRGRKHHKSSIFRWASKGLHGTRLRSVSVGGTRATTRAWLLDFFEAVAQAEDAVTGSTTSGSSPGSSYPDKGPNQTGTRRTHRTLRRGPRPTARPPATSAEVHHE